MTPPGADTVLVRYGEIGAKSSGVRGRMERQLCTNLGAVIDAEGVDGRVERLPTRPLVRTPDPERAGAVLSRVPGVASLSVCRTVAPERGAVVDALAETAESLYETGTFAVRARCPEGGLSSMALQRAAGSEIESRVAHASVDLDAPDFTVRVEVRAEEAFVFVDSRDGPGGLPVGTQEPVVALVSGGIDSPVAAYQLLRRGAPVIPVYIELGEYGGPDHEARAVASVNRLQRLAPTHDLRPYVVDGGEAVAALADAMDRGRMLSLRRYMLRVAEAIADREGADGIVTGEALGQKSSQTARNLKLTSAATRLPVHRPLLTLDKPAIVERAKALGTYEEASIPAGCNRLAPARPETRGRLSKLQELEPAELFAWAARDAAAATRIDAF
ncbi:tRNA sulfurtransferase [Natronomonas sp. EA1]|uniref:tRNA sulfurtransferase n=1 Tax=Natronomonas sp. EA1 TaxID=3421655 RepID=UPI003EBE6F3F